MPRAALRSVRPAGRNGIRQALHRRRAGARLSPRRRGTRLSRGEQGGRLAGRAWRGRELLATTCRSEEHTSELQSRLQLVCRLLLQKKKARTELHILSDF